MPPTKKADQVGKLIAQRASNTNSIQRISELIESRGESFSQAELQCRLEIVNNYFQQVLVCQSAIEELDYEPEQLNALDIRMEFEELYCGVKSKIMVLIAKKAVNIKQQVESKVVPAHDDNLPKLKLPQFSGKYADFPNFKMLFDTLVHNNVRLTAIEKFNHLLSCLSGPALRTVKALDVTESNYVTALELLESRFNNKFLMCEEHIKELFHLPKLQRATPESLRMLVDTVTARFNALCSLNTFEEISNALIVHLALSSLDNESLSKMQEAIDYSKHISWTECASFLNKRCQLLESRSSKPSIEQQQHRGKQKDRNIHSVSLVASNNHCVCCQQTEHQLWKCPKFMSMNPLQRYEVAKAAQLCLNCLSPQHSVKQCKASTCKYCKGNHHSFLHRNNVNRQQTYDQQQQQLLQHQQQFSPQQQLQQQQSSPQQQQLQQAQISHRQQQLQSQQQTSQTPQQQNHRRHLPPQQPQLQHQCEPEALNNHAWSTAMVSQQFDNHNNSNHQVSANEHTILATAVVKVFDKYGKEHLARALLDSASQLNFLSRSLAQRLDLDNFKTNIVIGGIGESHTRSNFSTIAKIASRTSDFETSLNFLILPSITGQQPDRKIDIDNWQIPSNIELADQRFNVPQKIDMLIGADVFFKLFNGQQISLGHEHPTLMGTKLGWIVSGRCKIKGMQQFSLVSSQIEADMQLESQVKLFWELEKIPDATRKLSKEHLECEDHFINHVQRLESGRFMVKLPYKMDASKLGDSKTMAVRRFLSLEKRLASDAQLKQSYVEFLEQYLADGHMTRIPWPTTTTDRYFMPHHCVLRPDKSTTKCRVVFDASAKSTTGVSLNDILMTGPVVQNELIDILLRFRLHKFGLMADIAAMYRQIAVYPADYKVQNIVWRNNSNEELQLFNLKTVTYGTTPAPYLATRCLIQLADDNRENNPVAANIIKNDFYVDDLITGGASLEDIKAIKESVTDMLMQAQFHLRKWHSNHHRFLNTIPEEDREKPIKINNSDVVKALGIIWDSASDSFKFNYTIEQQQDPVVTKRKVLSQLAKLFDPLGLVNPIVVKVKVFLQELWLKELDWDEAIPDALANAWLNFASELTQINDIKVPRYVLIENATIQLHGFADASSRAYGCCFYIRCIDAHGNISVNLYTAKSKVAPISTVRSMPSLELCASHIMVQLYEKLRTTLYITDVTLWSDSVIVLSWLAEHASNFNTFVANRVAFIQEKTNGIKWKYVPSSSNPADYISRGTTVQELISSFWFTGPSFLHNEESVFPVQPKRLSSTELPDRKNQKSILLACNDQSSLLKNIYSCSHFIKICRRFAYIRRFTQCCRDANHRANINTIQLTAREIDDAFLHIVSIIQHDVYSSEIGQLKQGKQINARNSLKMLNPFVENENGLTLLKVGGRLKNADIPYETKCPIILPKNDAFVQCYVRHLHLTNLHAGAQSLVCLIRQKFWIIGAREYARKIVQKCVHCFRYKPRLLSQIMGDLPKDRVTALKPFTHCGVDFCGPILTTLRMRGKPKYKTYIAVFICFATRAIHMEVVSDLTSDAFIAALKRFVARRGLCSTLYLDNATNFVGARNKLQEFRDAFLNQGTQQQLTSWCVSNGIEFKHIPPRSPHFGGLWEAAVKSAKTILYKAMQSAILTFEELSTLVTQVEGMLNSRPLTALPADPSDEQVLTPAHFLNMTNSETILEPQASFQKISLLKHWQQISALQQHFWSRWTKEFLTTLQQRRKWDCNIPNIEPGTIVMIQDDSLPPQKWLIGRITQTFKGADNKVRVAEVKTSAGVLRRAIVKLALIIFIIR